MCKKLKEKWKEIGEKWNKSSTSRSAVLIYFFTPATLTSLMAHFSIILLILFNIVYPAANTSKAIDSYISSGAAISAAIAVIITTVITHIFNPNYDFKIRKFRNIILPLLSFVIVIIGLINLLMINFSIDSNLINIYSLNTYGISIAVCSIAFLVTYISFRKNYEPDAAEEHLRKMNEDHKDLQVSIDKKEAEAKYSDD